MDDEYEQINVKGLAFKGDKRKSKKVKDETSSGQNLKTKESSEKDVDTIEHGGWYVINDILQLKYQVVIEFIPHAYVRAESDGSIVLGPPHDIGEQPDPQEIFTPVCASSNQFALKSGFGRYLSVDNEQRITGVSQAIGEKEQFMPVFEGNETAICTFNGNFISPDEDSEDFQIVARASKVSDYEKLKLRVRKPDS